MSFHGWVITQANFLFQKIGLLIVGHTLQHDFFSKEKKCSTLEKHLPLFINLVSPNVVLEFPFTLVHSKLH